MRTKWLYYSKKCNAILYVFTLWHASESVVTNKNAVLTITVIMTKFRKYQK